MSFVTASSLSGDYADVRVYITRDQYPVVTTNWNVSIKGIDIPIGSLTLDKVVQLQNDEYQPVEETLAGLSKITHASQVHATLKNRIVPLSDLLRAIPVNVNLNILVLYPTALEVQESKFCLSCDTDLNEYVDNVLKVVFDHAREIRKANMNKQTPGGTSHGSGPTRAILFSAANPDVCAVLNWKQPNYPVFFFMNGFQTNGRYISAHQLVHDRFEDRRCVSLKDATTFASTNNLLGIICSSDVLNSVPSVVSSVKATGLVLVANNPKGDTSDVDGVDGLRTDHVLNFKQSIDM
jgi:CDK inhibitor PHO81